MKDTKRRMELFSFYDHTGLEKHLARMAEKGWLLDKIGSFTWHYRRVEPKKLTFSVCYFPQASPFDPGPSEEQETFYDFCAHTGWTLAAASAQLQVFYNERENPTPIDTDPALEVEAIHKSAKKSWLIPQALLASAAVLNIIMFLFRLHNDPIRTLAAPSSLFLAVCWPSLLLMIGIDTGNYFLWRRRALRAAEQGEFLPTSSHPLLFQKILLAVVLLALAWLMSTLSGSLFMAMVVSLAGTVAALLLVTGIREALKQRKASAGTNKAVTLAAIIGLSLLITAAIPFLTISCLGRDRDIPPDGLPLTLDDLTDVGDYDYAPSDYLWRTESPLLAWFEVRQSPWRHEDMVNGAPSLRYTVTVVKAPFLYGACKDYLISLDTRGMEGLGYQLWYEPADPAPWGAVEVYRQLRQSGPQDDYLLCYPDRIVDIRFGWEPTPAQMAVVAEKLGGR